MNENLDLTKILDDEANYKKGYHDASEKFHEWLKNNWREYVYQDGDGIIHFGHWESDFCKVMGNSYENNRRKSRT